MAGRWRSTTIPRKRAFIDRGLLVTLISLQIVRAHKFAALLLCLIAVSGSASVAQPSTPIRRVGIIVALGDQIEFTHVGWTVFDSRNLGLQISDWHLDDQITQEAAELIGSKFVIVPIIYNKDSFYMQNVKWPLPLNPKLGPLIMSRPSDESDAYLVIRRTAVRVGENDFEGLSTATFRGFVGIGGPNSACATLEFELVKAGDAKVLASSIIPSICTNFSRRDLADSPDQMTELQLHDLHQIFKTLVSQVLVRSLTAMGLTGSE
jgi:hypothetical protein